MFSRKVVNPRQIPILIGHGFLPVSFDFRFCPELNVLDGPMDDVCEALRWARFQLPSLAPTLAPGLEADGEKVAAVGWSTGGHLSMTLGFTAPQRGIRAPEAILAFYCPTDYESECECSSTVPFPLFLHQRGCLRMKIDWKTPIHVKFAISSSDEPYNVLEGFQKEPVSISLIIPRRSALGPNISKYPSKHAFY